MPFDLNISFVGMCMFVPAPAGPDPDRLHVILVEPPESAHGNGHGGHAHAVERHHARLLYNTAHDRAGQRPAEDFNSIGLDYKVLDLSRLSGEIDTTLENVPDLSDITGKTIPREFVGDVPREGVAARITLAAGRVVDRGETGPWELEPPPAPQRMIAFRVTWRIPGIDADRLDWSLGGLNGMGGQPLTPLFPVEDESAPSGKSIDLRIVNVPRHEISMTDIIPPPPPRGTESPHYGVLYTLFDKPAVTPKPIWRGEEGRDGGGVGSAYSCMEGKGKIGGG